jgi:3',5'-cyclic AMP phosphodiesterase CpdA
MIMQDARKTMEDVGIARDDVGIVPGDFSEDI